MKSLIAKIAVWLFGIVTCILASVCLVNQVLVRVEAAQYPAPGIMVTLGDSRMHVATLGGGKQTIVVMPGLGSTAPWLEYQDLIKPLSKTYRVVMAEPFGYGWSDGSSLPRTAAAVVDETRNALRLAGIQPPYLLMPHSISGLYSLDWADRHPEELLGVIGLDTSVPGQTAYLGLPRNDPLDAVAHVLGWVRIYVLFKGLLEPPGQKAPTQGDAGAALFLRNYGNATVRNETDMAGVNFRELGSRHYPPELPVRLILSSDLQNGTKANGWKQDWVSLHEQLFSNPSRQKVQVMAGDHFIFRGNELAIMEVATALLKAR